MPIIMIIGAALFFVGGGVFLATLFSSGGWQRSRQFAVLGQLCSGELGGLKRLLCLLSMGTVLLGALSLFGGVAAMDAQRADRCRDHCDAAGYALGTIGPSLDRTPANRFVACTCTAPDRAPLELRADSVGE